MTGPWKTTDEVADYFNLPVKSVRRRIRLGNELPNDPQAIRARNFGTEKKPLYRVHASELRRIDGRRAA